MSKSCTNGLIHSCTNKSFKPSSVDVDLIALRAFRLTYILAPFHH